MNFDARAKYICDNWKMFSINKSDPPLQDLITEALQEAFEQGRKAALEIIEGYKVTEVVSFTEGKNLKEDIIEFFNKHLEAIAQQIRGLK